MRGQQAQERPNHRPKPRHRPARQANAAIRAVVIAVLAVATALASLTGSSTVSAQQEYGPSAPLNLEATIVSATQINLTWETPTSTGPFPPIKGYRIWVSTGPNSPWTRTVYNTGTTATAYSHTGLSSGDYRRYQVAGLDKDLDEGEKSNIASTTIAVPTAPLNPAATPGNREVTLTWLPPADDRANSIQKYQVRHAETGGNYGSWSDVAGAAAARTHTVIDLTNGIEYTFQVRAINPVGNGAEGTVEATPFSLEEATTPLNLAAAAGYKEVTLTWLPPADSRAATVEKYQVRHAEIDGDYGSWTDVADGAEARTHTVTGLTNFQKYKFQLNAVTTLGSTRRPARSGGDPARLRDVGDQRQHQTRQQRRRRTQDARLRLRPRHHSRDRHGLHPHLGRPAHRRAASRQPDHRDHQMQASTSAGPTSGPPPTRTVPPYTTSRLRETLSPHSAPHSATSY